MSSFSEVRLSGGPLERGRQHGSQLGDLIRVYLDHLFDHSRKRREALLRGAMAALPLLDAYAPDLIEEIRGIAQGARLSLAEALLCNVRGEAERFARTADVGTADSEGGCTAFAVTGAVTAARGVIAGQNSDQPAWNRDLMVVFSVKPDSGPGALMCGHAGLVGYHGCNGAGVGQFANALPTAGWRRRMPHYLLKRRLLEQATTGACVELLRSAQLASSGNYVLADRTGALADVELTPAGAWVLGPTDGVVVHTNHYEHPALVRLNPPSGCEGSVCRAQRLRALIEVDRGMVTVSTMKRALADHAGEAEDICRHAPGSVTVAAMIAELDHGRLHVAAGNPCAMEFSAYYVP